MLMLRRGSAEEPSEREPSSQPDHDSWTKNNTPDNADLFHHFWGECEAEQG